MDAPHSKQLLIISVLGFLFSKLVPMLPQLQVVAVIISIFGGLLSIALNIPRVVKLVKKWLIIAILFAPVFLTSCSSNWYLQKAIKKNPKLLDSLKVEKIIIKHDTVKGEVTVPKHDFTSDSLKYFNLYNTTVDLYNDSFVDIWGTFDSLSHLKNIKGQVKERKVPFEVIREVHDTITVDCPPQVVVKKGTPIKYTILICLLLAIFVILYLRTELKLWQQKRN